MAGFFRELHVRQYGCLQDVKCLVSPLHAFIGPNDSGKSTLLKLIGGLFVKDGGYPGDLHVFASFSDGSKLRVNYDQGKPGTFVEVGPQIEPLGMLLQRQPQPPEPMAVRMATGKATALPVHLNPDDLRKESPLIYGTQLLLQSGGGNIAGLYDAVRDKDNERFATISNQLTDLFPAVQRLGLQPASPNTKRLMVTLVDGTEVPSHAMSEGLLYYLAFAILAEIQRPAVYLVEEPENGLHPSRIKDIVRMLRSIAEDPTNAVQVLMATHSPLVVNELLPEEVTVVTRDPRTGTKLTAIQATPNFEERSKVYALGELWLSYADGKAEAPLLVSEGR
jgi:ABC-type Mn2+/Zn2+ transport system ATPase subunit